MRNATRTSEAVPKWLWAALGVGILMLLGAIWWAGSTDGDSRAAATPRPYQPAGAGPVVVGERPPMVHPPSQTQSPWIGGDYSRPRVMVAPVQGFPTPKPIKIPVAEPIPRPAHVTRAVSPMADMFPFGPVSPRAEKSTRDNQCGNEQFPSFTYGGVSWTFTGAFADAGQVALTATGLELGGRSLLMLADTSGPASVLFVQSKLEPEKFAIYQ